MVIPILLCFFSSIVSPPGAVIDHESRAAGRYIGSPSLVILPNGDYVSSHDFFGPNSRQSVSGVTRVFLSRDRGASWNQVAELHDQFWSNLFLQGRRLYLMGTSGEYGRVTIRQSQDGGRRWGQPVFLTADSNYHTAPVPVVEKDGRLWRAMEYHPPGPWGSFEAFVMSARADANLLDPLAWRMTERLKYPEGLGGGQTWLEGNAVVAPGGRIEDILRVADVEKIAILRVEGQRLQFVGLADFPGGSKKFTIRYDSRSGKYWTLSNPALKEYALSATDPGSVRNTLALMSSRDLLHWKIERSILSHPDPAKYGFQYVDWQFDRQDIVAVSRTAFNDDSGGPPRAHDANFMTFHRIINFRDSGQILSSHSPVAR